MVHTKKKIVLFDIDYTLFDAMKFRKAAFLAIAEHLKHKNKETFLQIAEEVYAESKNTISYFDPEEFIPSLAKRLQISLDTQEVEKIIMQEKILESALYTEIVYVFEKLSEDKDMILGILSTGKIKVQTAKIAFIKKHLTQEHIHIFEFNKIHALQKLLSQYTDFSIFLIDDYPELLFEAKKLRPDLYTIWIKRNGIGETRQTFDNFVPDSIISTLSEVVPILMEKSE